MNKMKRLLTGLTIVILNLLLINTAVWADSLWTDRGGSLYSGKPKAYKVGDLLTIVVVEQASASQKAESNNGENGSVNFGASTGTWEKLFPEFGTQWKSASKGTGTTTRGGTLTAKITVFVKEVSDSGLLTVEGQQVIKVNKEEQVLRVSGVVRQDDITSDNMVYSTYVANAVIEYNGKGTVGDTQGTGLLTKIFHWIF